MAKPLSIHEIMKRRKKAQDKVAKFEARLALYFTKLKGARKQLSYYDRVVEKALTTRTEIHGPKRLIDL